MILSTRCDFGTQNVLSYFTNASVYSTSNTTSPEYGVMGVRYCGVKVWQFLYESGSVCNFVDYWFFWVFPDFYR